MKRYSLTEKIPEYLQPYIVQQDASLYTPIDHASWRYILKISRAYFARHAHQKYLDGLRETGISTERIPLIQEMDECLRQFNWRAVAVSGFIPPAVFMEFLSLGILTIASDMRKIENLAYTPAPDIVHEAAGHAPIIADPEYRNYLRGYGEVSQKAIFSSQDLDVYNAIRNLSDTKEDPHSTPAQIAAAEKRFEDACAAVDHISEATYLSRMAWWTFEYGLVGEMKNPKIYGAGLLSSVSESYHCLGEGVKKIPFSINCIHTTYDITQPQPQLFVSPDFQTLAQALEDLANTMAFRKGGMESLEKARKAATTTTTVLESGIQISGTLAGTVIYAKGQACYLKYQGPTQLSYQDAELEGQGPEHHAQGFSTPVGMLKIGKSPSDLKEGDLASLGLVPGKRGRLEFESGVVVEGELTGSVMRDGRCQLLTFKNCMVRKGDEIFFQPDWGVYDMACGSRVTSVFGGAADRSRYLAKTGGFKEAPVKPKTNLTKANAGLNELYAKVRKIRESGPTDWMAISKIHDELEKKFPDDWLLRYELVELAATQKREDPWLPRARARLDEIARTSAEKAEVIGRGLALL